MSTGEDVPRGESLRARMLVLELSPGSLDWERLSGAQKDAARGLYAQAMAGFVKWLAARYDAVQAGLKDETSELRQQACQSAAHRRTPDIVANLAVGLRYYLAFAQEAGALTAGEADALWERGWQALGQAAALQSGHQAAEEPTRRFLELLAAAIASGRAHVAGPDGGPPDEPQAWGWRHVVVGTGDNEREEWRPQGHLVGWVDAEDLYLEPQASYAEAQALAREAGDTLAVSPRTLHKRLDERRLLASKDEGRERLTVRQTLGERRRAVLHIHTGSLVLQEPSQPSQSAQTGADEAESGPGRGPVAVAPMAIPSQEPSQTAGCEEGPGAGQEQGLGQMGQLGRLHEEERDMAPEAVTIADDGAASPPSQRCYTCGGRRFWRYAGGEWRCANCHPPTDEEFVAEGVEVQDGEAEEGGGPPWWPQSDKDGNGAKCPGGVLPRIGERGDEC